MFSAYRVHFRVVYGSLNKERHLPAQYKLIRFYNRKECVNCAVRAESFNTIRVNLSFSRIRVVCVCVCACMRARVRVRVRARAHTHTHTHTHTRRGADGSLAPKRKETSYSDQTRDLFNILSTKLNTLLSPLL